MLVLDIYSYSMLPIAPPRRKKSLRSSGRSSAHLLDEMTPAVASANHSPFLLRNPLWKYLDFVPGRVKPRPTFSSYSTRSPPPPRISRLSYRKTFKTIFHSGAFSYSRKYCTHLHTFRLTLSVLMVNIRETIKFRQLFARRLTTKTITLRVAQPTSTFDNATVPASRQGGPR